MDAFPLLFAGTVAGGLGFSGYAAYRAFKGAGETNIKGHFDLIDNIEKPNRSKGFIKTSNVLSVFPDGVIRTRDGGYIKGYKFRPSETFYAGESEVRRLYERFALLVASALPKDSVIQIRFDNSTDPGNLLNDQLLDMSSSATECDPVAQILKHEELNYFFDLAQGANFRQGLFSVWVYIPSPGRRATTSGFGTTWNALRSGDFEALKETFFSGEKKAVSRFIDDETKCYETAVRYFRTFEQNFPLKTKELTFDEVCVRLRISHNPDSRSLPAPPQLYTSDWQSYLSRTAIKHEKGEWYLWHGNIPFTIVTLFEPPESNAENPTCFPGLMRFITTNPTLRSRCTVIPEFITFDKDESVKALKKELKRMKETNTRPSGGVEFKDDKTKRIYQEKRQMLAELTSPGKSLTNMRFAIVIRGREIKFKDEKKQILRELEEHAQDIIKLVNENMQGAQADFEDPHAILEIYEKTLLGEISPATRHREIKEQALSLACFIPAESDWKGVQNGAHNFFVNTSGELIGVNLLRNPYASTPLTLILGSSGSGKSVLAADLISGFLGSIPNARVRACDYGGSLAPLVNLFEGRYFRFSESDRRTINVWDYDGLEKGAAPDDAQIELVVKDTLILLGADERTEIGKDFIAVLEKCVRQVYSDEVSRNAPGRRHEPRLSHLIRKLRTFPFESSDEKQIAGRMASRLENFEGNPWVDAETDESYRSTSRFDVFELSSLDKLPDSLRSCLAFRIGARVGTGDDSIEGVHPPTLVVYDEVHEYVHNEYLSHTLRGAEKTTRHGRKKNKVPVLITHSFDDIADFPGFTSNLGSIFVGKQDDITSLKELRKWNSSIEQTVLNIDNQKGLAHQFLFATGQGDNQKITTVQVYLSPISLWTFTTDPPEDEARKVVANALPHWQWSQVLIWLARNYPRGLSAEGKTKIDQDRLLSLVDQEQKLNPQFKQYVKQMGKMRQDIFALPEELDLELFADEAMEVVSGEIDRIKRENFSDIAEIPAELASLGFDLPGAVVVSVQGDN